MDREGWITLLLYGAYFVYELRTIKQNRRSGRVTDNGTPDQRFRVAACLRPSDCCCARDCWLFLERSIRPSRTGFETIPLRVRFVRSHMRCWIDRTIESVTWKIA